jgi:inner membrane protein
MASVFSHAVASVAIGKATLIKNTTWKFWLLGIFCAAIPDADAIGFWYGVPYESFWGHRGFTHSFFFAAILAFMVNFVFYRKEKLFSKSWWMLWLFFFLSAGSHPILDAMTSGGEGVAFFPPFNNERYFFPFRPVTVSPIGVAKFFSTWGWKVIKSEFVWIWIPSALVILVVKFLKNNV